MADELLEALERTRPGYEAECVWHKFLMDAYLGTGGFAGAIKQAVAGFWGAAAEMYSGLSIAGQALDTYLDRYPSENDRKFNMRVAGTQYDNYVEALTDLKVSYVLRKEFEARNIPKAISDWRTDVDGRGTTWNDIRANNAIVAAVLGWRPLLIDARAMPKDEKGEPLVLNAAQAREVGMRAYPVPLFPANLVDYTLDDAGQFADVKIRTTSQRRKSWKDERETVTHYTIWTPTRFEKYEVTESNGHKSAQLVDEGPHNFGAVPLVIYQHKASPTDPVQALPMHKNVSIAARAHLNRMSEFNEHLRGQVFAVLVVASQGGQLAENLLVGTDNALPIDQESKQPHAFIAPPATVASTYETRLESIVREMYRVARVEYTRPTGGISSGEAHAYEFAQTNAALAEFAKNIARAEDDVDFFVGKYLGVNDNELANSANVPPDNFDVENLAADIKDAFDLITGEIGATATKLLKMRLIDQALPRLAPKTRAIIEAEVDALHSQDTADKALAEEAEAARLEAASTAAAEAEAAKAELAAA